MVCIVWRVMCLVLSFVGTGRKTVEGGLRIDVTFHYLFITLRFHCSP